MSNILHLFLCLLDTRGESFEEHNESGKRLTQKEKAFQFLLKNDIAVTSRSLSELINIERTNATRILKDLEIENRIYVAHIARCPKTKKNVNHYRIVPTIGQGKLFAQ